MERVKIVTVLMTKSLVKWFEGGFAANCPQGAPSPLARAEREVLEGGMWLPTGQGTL